MTEAELKKLIAEANARLLAMTPEERATHWEAQRQSWVRGEMSWIRGEMSIRHHGGGEISHEAEQKAREVAQLALSAARHKYGDIAFWPTAIEQITVALLQLRRDTIEECVKVAKATGATQTMVGAIRRLAGKIT